MIYKCKQLDPTISEEIIQDAPIILKLEERYLNASIANVQFDPFYNTPVWAINEKGNEPILYEGLEFEILDSFGDTFGKFKVL